MEKRRCGVSGSTLKIIAVISMAFDHISKIVLTNGIMMHAMTSQISDEQWALLTKASDILHVLGRVAFPLFCYLIVEGFLHTHDLKKYLRNILVFAIISEPIYDYVYTESFFDFQQQNVMFELLLGLLLLSVLKQLQNLSNWKAYTLDAVLIVAAALMAEHVNLDGGVYGILLVATFYLFRKNRNVMLLAAVGAILLSFCHVIGGGFEFTLKNMLDLDVAAAFASLLFIALYNGKRGLKLKYFFYVFYPVHLALLYGISLLICSQF